MASGAPLRWIKCAYCGEEFATTRRRRRFCSIRLRDCSELYHRELARKRKEKGKLAATIGKVISNAIILGLVMGVTMAFAMVWPFLKAWYG